MEEGIDLSSGKPKKRRASTSVSKKAQGTLLSNYDPQVQFGDKEIATAFFNNLEGYSLKK